MKILILPHDPAWAQRFAILKSELTTILKPFDVQIEHIGSTAVPGLAAKPIIDISVGLQQNHALDSIIAPMLSQHYIYYEVYNALMPERRLFMKLRGEHHLRFSSVFRQASEIPHEKVNAVKLAHIHVWKLGKEDWIRHIAFREYLKAHSEVRQQYEKLKKALSQRIWKDGNAYNQAKNDFIKTEEQKALEWYQASRE